MLKTIELEYYLNTSPKILFPRLSTASGLTGWFAEKVTHDANYFTFKWNKIEDKAKLTEIKENYNVKFNWVDKPDTYFEFRLTHNDLTGSTILNLTDCTEEDDTNSSKEVWDSQIATLKHMIGL